MSKQYELIRFNMNGVILVFAIAVLLSVSWYGYEFTSAGPFIQSSQHTYVGGTASFKAPDIFNPIVGSGAANNEFTPIGKAIVINQ